MPKKRKNKMTKTEKLREILKKSVGHGIVERKRECDCIWCRKGGTFDQALSAIQQWALECVGENKKIDYPIISDGDSYDTGSLYLTSDFIPESY